MSESLKQIRIAFVLLVILTLLTGLIYPLLVTGIAQLIFPWQANGSLIKYKGKIIGSSLIGQSFSDSRYFWGRPSATTPFPYNAANSSGSNMGPSNADFLTQVKDRVHHFKTTHPDIHLVPVDLVTASGSGVDPEVSPLAAYAQIQRIAKARNMSEKEVRRLIDAHIQSRTFKVLGEPRVNVLQLNLALEKLQEKND